MVFSEITKPSLSAKSSVYTFLHVMFSLFVAYIVSFQLFVWYRPCYRSSLILHFSSSTHGWLLTLGHGYGHPDIYFRPEAYIFFKKLWSPALGHIHVGHLQLRYILGNRIINLQIREGILRVRWMVNVRCVTSRT